MMPTLAELAAALIAVFEGERLTPYRDSGGVWTDGIGNTHGVQPGVTITHTQAIEDFERNDHPLLALVTDKPIVAAAAYVSFGFNCGCHALENVLAGKDSILNPVHTTDRHGNVLAGLVARRRLESMLIEIGQA